VKHGFQDNLSSEKSQNKFTSLNKCVSIFTGIAFGFASGALAGAAIGGGGFEDGVRGALSGASVLPIVQTHQIFPLEDETALYTIGVNVGYPF
jgi:hypothetical protein